MPLDLKKLVLRSLDLQGEKSEDVEQLRHLVRGDEIAEQLKTEIGSANFLKHAPPGEAAVLVAMAFGAAVLVFTGAAAGICTTMHDVRFTQVQAKGQEVACVALAWTAFGTALVALPVVYWAGTVMGYVSAREKSLVSQV